MTDLKPTRTSLLWSITDDSGCRSFLFGTMHVRSRVAHQFLAGVLPYLAQCSIFAAEMNLEEFDPQIMGKSTTLSHAGHLSKTLTPRHYDKLHKSLLKSFGVDLRNYDHRHPFLISSAIAESLLTTDAKDSLDQALWNQAKDLGKVCTGLESFRDQMDIMDQISVEETIKQIREIGRNPQRFRRNMQGMIDYYVAQDVRKLYQGSRRQLQGLRKLLLFERNEKMVAKLDQLITTEKQVFAGVGAAHLGGKQGMLRLLKMRNYKIKPIKIAENLEAGDN